MPSYRTTSTRIALVATLAATPWLTTPTTSEAAPGPVSTTVDERARAANVALSKVRSPYRWGATGPRAFDCSGLVAYAYRVAGHPLKGRTSFDLHRHGARIRRAALRPGDLVYTWDRRLGHVGMYIGRGRYVHAPGTGRRVQVAPVPAGRGLISAIRP